MYFFMPFKAIFTLLECCHRSLVVSLVVCLGVSFGGCLRGFLGVVYGLSGRMSVGCLHRCLGGCLWVVCRGVWEVSAGVSGGCLWGVWWVSVGCLGFFSRVSTGCL